MARKKEQEAETESQPAEDSKPEVAIEHWPLTRLKPYKRNAKNHPPDQIALLAKIIEKHGFDVPIVVDKKGVIIKGHGRWLAAKTLGLPTVPVIVRDLDAARASEARIADNRVGETGWDFDVLVADVVGNLRDGLDPDLIGFSLEQLGLEMNAEGDVLQTGEVDVDAPIHTPTIEDEAPPVPKKAKTKLGQIWQLGAHRLVCGDSGSEQVWAALMNGDKARLIATDPPYGVAYTKTKAGMIDEGWADIKNDELQGRELQVFLEGVFKTLAVHLDKAAWYLWHACLTEGYFSAAAAAADVFLHRQIIWVKPNFILTRSGMYHWRHEPCFYGWIRGQQPPWYGPKNQSSIWEIPHDERKRVHPTQKPVELFAIPMRNHLQPGEVCVEPFGGSGSQIIAAEQLGVSCRVAELAPEYCDVIIERWQNLTGGKAKILGTI